MADSRVTFAQAKAFFDNIAKAVQILKATVGDSFQTTSTEYTGTLRETQRYLVETRLRAWTSDSALQRVTPVAVNTLAELTPYDASVRMVADLYGPQCRAMLQHLVEYGNDLVTTGLEQKYSSASAAWAAMWADAGSTASDKCLLGETVDVLAAQGVRWDPTYAVPPEHLELCRVTFTGSATATLSTKAEIDPIRYTNHTTEWYVVARGTPAAATISLVAKDEQDTAADDPGTTFTSGTITDVKVAGDVGDISQTDSHELHSTKGATLTVTGGENGLIVALRVKQFRAAAK